MQGRKSKPKASLTASHSSTVAEELVVLLRHLHSFDSWNPLINDFISARLNSIAETASQSKVRKRNFRRICFKFTQLISGCGAGYSVAYIQFVGLG
jgi:hypothetical protein